MDILDRRAVLPCLRARATRLAMEPPPMSGCDAEPAAMQPLPGQQLAGPSLGNWAMLAGALCFVLLGVVLLPSERDVAIVTLALFGFVSAESASTIVRKLRRRGTRPIRVELLGGVTLRPSRALICCLGASAAGVGGTVAVFGHSYPLVFRSIAWLFVGLGVMLLLGAAMGWIPAGCFRVDAAGILFARRHWACAIPWNNISRISAGEVHDTPTLFICLERIEDVEVHPAWRKPHLLSYLAWNEDWAGAHVILMAATYEIDVPLLSQALVRYLEIPCARLELARPFPQ